MTNRVKYIHRPKKAPVNWRARYIALLILILMLIGLMSGCVLKKKTKSVKEETNEFRTLTGFDVTTIQTESATTTQSTQSETKEENDVTVEEGTVTVQPDGTVKAEGKGIVFKKKADTSTDTEKNEVVITETNSDSSSFKTEEFEATNIEETTHKDVKRINLWPLIVPILIALGYIGYRVTKRYFFIGRPP